MLFRRHLGVTSSFIAALASVPHAAHATNVDRPHFQVDPVVILWAADDSDGTAPVVVDFIVEDSSGVETDLIAANGRTLLTGSLTATPDATNAVQRGTEWQVRQIPGNTLATIDTKSPAAFSAFDMADNVYAVAPDSHHTSAMFAASNTPFSIRATASVLGTPTNFSLADIAFDSSVSSGGNHGGLSFGASTSNPSITRANSGQKLSEFTGEGLDVFVASEATAATPGSIAQQSVRLQVGYVFETDLIGAFDLADGYGEIQAEVTYTAYVP
ncbi:MAG: hypothetical protein AAGL90_16650 [Pseudomonadota bacterium]